MFKNKKGFVVEFLADLYVFIIFLLLMLIFTVLFYLAGETVKTEIKSEYENLDGNTILLNYLRTPVEINTRTMNIAELILISSSSREYRRELKTITQDLLNKLNIISNKDDYSIRIEFSDETIFIGRAEGLINRFLWYKLGQREVDKIKLSSLTEDIHVSIFNYKGDVTITNFIKEAEVGDRIPSFDGTIYIYWGDEPFSRWTELGGAWSQDGWPCDTTLGDNKVVCKSGYEPKFEDASCFVTGDSFKGSRAIPPKDPKNCFKKDKDGKIISKSYYEEVTAKKEEEKIEGECKKSFDADSFSKFIESANIGDCVIAPDKTEWTYWGAYIDLKLWSNQFICDKTVIQKRFMACEDAPNIHPAETKGRPKFKVQIELLNMYK